MGYFSLDIKKAKGSSDTVQSDHIERRIIPKNADPTRTHLNRVLIEYPDGVHGRDEAIAHRLNTAGIKRKITHDQVRVVRVVLSGTHEDMMDIQENGRLDEWCSDSIQWLQATFGRENVVAAHLHMDEKTPHIHAAIVPIVTGERRKAKKEQEDGKRKYHKKANTVRLCADDLFNRQTLIAYHDNYARVMAKYGLQRGVRGSEARHSHTVHLIGGSTHPAHCFHAHQQGKGGVQSSGNAYHSVTAQHFQPPSQSFCLKLKYLQAAFQPVFLRGRDKRQFSHRIGFTVAPQAANPGLHRSHRLPCHSSRIRKALVLPTVCPDFSQIRILNEQAFPLHAIFAFPKQIAALTHKAVPGENQILCGFAAARRTVCIDTATAGGLTENHFPPGFPLARDLVGGRQIHDHLCSPEGKVG